MIWGMKKTNQSKSHCANSNRAEKCKGNAAGGSQYDGDNRPRRRKRQVKIAEQIEYKNGTTLVTFKDQKLKGETIDKYTSQQLQKYCGG